jgi:hypothetical protein
MWESDFANLRINRLDHVRASILTLSFHRLSLHSV